MLSLHSIYKTVCRFLYALFFTLFKYQVFKEVANHLKSATLKALELNINHIFHISFYFLWRVFPPLFLKLVEIFPTSIFQFLFSKTSIFDLALKFLEHSRQKYDSLKMPHQSANCLFCGNRR